MFSITAELLMAVKESIFLVNIIDRPLTPRFYNIGNPRIKLSEQIKILSYPVAREYPELKAHQEVFREPVENYFDHKFNDNFKIKDLSDKLLEISEDLKISQISNEGKGKRLYQFCTDLLERINYGGIGWISGSVA